MSRSIHIKIPNNIISDWRMFGVNAFVYIHMRFSGKNSSNFDIFYIIEKIEKKDKETNNLIETCSFQGI